MALRRTDTERKYTEQELMRLPDKGKRYELVKGKLVEMSPTGRQHGKIASLLVRRLGAYVEEHDSGEIYIEGTGFVIAPKTVRAPDVSFVKKERLSEATEEGYLPFAPDLAVEVISPTDRYGEVDEKVAEYLEAGVRLVWIVNPRRKYVEVYHSNNPRPETLTEDDELVGEDVLPGFLLKVRALFD